MFQRISAGVVAVTILTAVRLFAISSAEEAPPVPPSEQIQSYDSDITVNPDSTLLVHETIVVFGPGAKIKHGICRDLPTRYSDRFSNPYEIHFDVVKVERDGQPEDFHLEKLSNGLRVCMGTRSEMLSSGQHTYELTYTVDRELGFFTDHDELYWNVTGNGWILPIQAASATVHLPRGIAQVAIMPDAYTGRSGSVETEYTASTDDQSTTTFRSNRPLGSYEGLTIVLRWPKGFVSPPTDEMKRRFFLEDNRWFITGILGLLVMVLYYAGVWFMMGRHAGGAEVTPSAEPPRGFSPAAVRYIWRGTFDQKAMIAILVDLAIKKQMAILEDASGSFILGRINPDAQLSGSRAGSTQVPPPEITSDEKLVFKKIFAAGDTIRLEPAHRALIGGTVEALHQYLRSKMERVYVLINSRYLIPGLLISLATVVRSASFIQGAQTQLALFLALGLLLWSLPCFTLVFLTIDSWKYALSDPQHAPTARIRATLMSAICLTLIIGEVAGLVTMEWATSTGLTIILILLLAINYIAHLLLKSSTRSGKGLMDQIESFRMFLNSTEHDRRAVRNAVQSAPILFDRLLPYAMALNVEKVWSEKLATALAETSQGRPLDYSPTWYSGPAWDRVTAGSFANSLANSFTSAITFSSKAPRSSSGAARRQ